MKNLDDVTLTGKTVFLRADFNVPIKNGKVEDDTRIRATLPTIEKILKDRGKLVIASHLGRPKGKVNPEFSLAPVALHLSQLLGKTVTMAPDCIGLQVEELVSTMKEGDILMLENLRFHPGEEKNDPDFAKALSKGMDVYVNDAFAVSHRAHASVRAIVQFIKECCAGYQLQKEIEYYHKVLESPEKPVAFIIGGAKISTKIDLLQNLITKCDKMIIGGAMANTFLKALGKPVGKSLVEDDYLDTAKAFMEKAKASNITVILPEDVVVSESPESQEVKAIAIDDVKEDMMIFDVGEKTLESYKKVLSECKTILWNGPVGMFEKPQFSKGTFELAKFLGTLKVLTVAGGGDTVSALNKAGVYESFSYVSTGGGAFLEMLEGKILPGIEALEKC